MKTHKDLLVWKKSIELVTEVYALTKSFPEEEKFGLTNQLRRAAVSIPSNIAEGAARNSKKEFVRFLSIALGSSAELQTQLLISKNLEYLSEQNKLILEFEAVSKMISGLIRSVNKTNYVQEDAIQYETLTDY